MPSDSDAGVAVGGGVAACSSVASPVPLLRTTTATTAITAAMARKVRRWERDISP
jgi:hypothetical protein